MYSVRMATHVDPLKEFDDQPTDEFDDEIDPNDLPAVIADPAMLPAIVVPPKTGVPEQAPMVMHSRWRYIPMAVKERAFFCWMEFGDYVSVAAHIGMTVEQVRDLSKRDQWETRAEELRVGLESGLKTLLLESRRTAAQSALALMGNLDLASIAKTMEGKDVIKLIEAMAKMGDPGKAGLTVNASGGPTQVNVTPVQNPATSNLRELTDAQLADLARSSGIQVQPPPSLVEPKSVDRSPPSLPGENPGSGGQSSGFSSD